MSIHLWRQYLEEPYDRYALTAVFDAQADEGYHVVDHDPQVADAGFLHALAEHMALPAPAQDSDYEDGAILERLDWLRPGGERHFEEAIRTFPRARISGKGRP